PSYYWLFSDPFHSLFFAVTSSLSLLTNSLLIYTIFNARSADIDNYRYLLLCFALFDMVTSTMHFIALPHIHMTSTGFWFIPRNEGIFRSSGGTFSTILCFVYIASRSTFEDWTLAHWVALGAGIYVVYISAFLFCGWYTFMPSEYSRMVAPSFFIDLYNVDARDPDIGFFHITWK
ncbi:hypothetical protein PFISCL1PPCAC_14017, partial [Pristionchus fissidentatus]